MIRRAAVFLAAAVFAGATAVAAAAAFQVNSTGTQAEDARLLGNQTVIEKNSPFPVIGPLVVEQCKVEDCSDAS